MSIPANGTVSSSITVNQSFTITAVKVQLNITATQDGPLYLYLQAPNGTQVLLALGRGGDGANFANTVFADTASTAIGSAAAPFTGSFRPEIPLSIFNGMNADGVWKLTVQDRSGSRRRRHQQLVVDLYARSTRKQRRRGGRESDRRPSARGRAAAYVNVAPHSR